MTMSPVGTPYNPFAKYEAPDGIRRFTNAKLQSAIDDAIAAAGDSHFVAVAHHEYSQDGTADMNVTKVSGLVKTSNGRFTLVAAAYKDWEHGDLGVESKVVWKPF